MVELVGHTALVGTITDDVDEIVLLEDSQQLGETNGTVLAVVLGEKISSTGAKTKSVWH